MIVKDKVCVLGNGCIIFTCGSDDTVAKEVSAVHSVDRKTDFCKLQQKCALDALFVVLLLHSVGMPCKFDILANFIFKS